MSLVDETVPRLQPETAEEDRGLTWPLTLLLVAIAFGAVAQGAFYPNQVIVMVVIAVAAALLLLVQHPQAHSEAITPLTLMFLGLAASAVLSAWLAHYPVGANGVVLLMMGFVSVALVARTATRRGQELLITGVVVVGVLVVFVGVVAVLFRDARMATPAGGSATDAQLWRAASTFTYPNSEAGFLLLPTILAMARVAKTGASRLWRLAAVLLIFGILTTVSRGGSVGLAAGMATLFVISDRWALLRLSWSILIGAVVAFACLAPSLLAHPHPLLAAAGLLAGIALAQARSWSTARILLPALAVGGLLLALFIAGSGAGGAGGVPGLRLYLSSLHGRELGWAAAIDAFQRSPVFGIGPGHFFLRLNANGIAGYIDSHNEYLQLLAEQGAVGLGILLVGLSALLTQILRFPRFDDWLWTGSLAGIAALAVHSGFDFLWHVTVIPLVAVVALSILTSKQAAHQEGLG